MVAAPDLFQEALEVCPEARNPFCGEEGDANKDKGHPPKESLRKKAKG